MPPKPKYTREEVVNVALNTVRESGIDALTARELGKRLGTSARPVFTAFENMEELKTEVRKAAMCEYEEFSKDFEHYSPPFKRIGMLMVSFAVKEPELFKLLFMQKSRDAKSFQSNMENLGWLADASIKILEGEYGFNRDEAKIMFDQVWVYAYGLSTLCSMRVCEFSESEISTMLGRAFIGTALLIKSGKENLCGELPEISDDKV